MKICKIEEESIQKIADEWEKFHSRCISEVNSQLQRKVTAAENEAAEDLRSQKYTKDSINDWLIVKTEKSYLWADNVKADINKKYEKGVALLDEIGERQFTSYDLGWKFNVSFFNEKIEKSPKNNDDAFSVHFQGMNWTIGGVRIDFNPPDYEYTDWYNQFASEDEDKDDEEDDEDDEEDERHEFDEYYPW